MFYFLGERTFTASTPGIATFEWGNQLLLRPYGTFPHPNVLAFYLLFSFSVLLFSLTFQHKIVTVLKVIALVLLSLGIIFTFSRVIILLIPMVLLFRLYRHGVRMFALPIFVLVALTLLLFQRFEASFVRDLILRWELIKISWEVFLREPFFGVGLNNFHFHEILFQKNVTPILLQPVHNVYLLWISQTGLFGLIALFFFVKKTISINGNLLFSALLFIAFVVGFFDHYLLTLQQGQLLLAIILGFCYSKERVHV
jgi:O-antigen ligase